MLSIFVRLFSYKLFQHLAIFIDQTFVATRTHNNVHFVKRKLIFEQEQNLGNVGYLYFFFFLHNFLSMHNCCPSDFYIL